jgi:OmcA/MtrC family decaheme c-type cytochrome
MTLAGETTGPFLNNAVHPANSANGTCLNSSCHNPGAPADPDLVHKPVTPPNTNSAFHVDGGDARTNAAWVASNHARLPAGAIKVTYEVKEVRLTTPARNPVIVFRVLMDGVATPILDVATAPNNPASGRKEMFANFMGGPSAQFVWAEPQDGVTAPVDFNKSASFYLRGAWDLSNVNATLVPGSGGDAGYYVATQLNATVPVGAVMFYGGIGYSYQITTTLPLTQTNLAAYPLPDGSGLDNPNNATPTGGLIVIAPNAQKLGTGFTARRAIVDDKRCQSCHQELGAFTENVFHGGQRNDGTTCSWCHNPNRSNTGWSVDSTAFVHAIHAGDKRTVPYNYHGVDWSHIVYPGVLARCEQCHVPGSYDFANSASADAVGLGADQTDKRLPRVTASGVFNDPMASGLAPYIVPLIPVDFGASGAATNLVMSPTATVCSACHDSNLAISHMEVNGGSFYDARSAALGRTEQCFVCHASGKVADIKVVHER